ncbi:hypothetical protein [Sulfuriroseicoccus oceanibius]|uniref:Uncharacterized protein n=1 Tax=Sulfuriroseicoccus oceanibius TaxID=2707525 RepID=A0A6B3LAU9_9BACT|nr:hypothetical protein [Sulfuriroseicoccus oceanibius]QQL45613.1 hypothetical protein G3M56_003215 [Sulfuriroseicoccus oceanibius]
MPNVLRSSEFLMPMVICLLASGLVLWFYRTRNPVKKFRPAWGELVFWGLMLAAISTVVSFFVFKTITEGQQGIESLKKQAEGFVPGGRGGADEAGSGAAADSVFEQSLSDSSERRQSRPAPPPSGD